MKKQINLLFAMLLPVFLIGGNSLQLNAVMHNHNPQTQTQRNMKDQNGKFVLPALPYAYDALEPYIDEATMRVHHLGHHQAFVNNLNNAIAGTELEGLSIEEILKNVSKHPPAVRNNAGGFWNHYIFWLVMGPNSQPQPDGELLQAIERRFGSFTSFREQFTQASISVFGSGWAWLIVDADKQLQITTTPNQDNPLMDVAAKRGIPVFGLDVWEHAYYLKHQNRRAAYVNDFWNVVNWDEVERRYFDAIN